MLRSRAFLFHNHPSKAGVTREGERVAGKKASKIEMQSAAYAGEEDRITVGTSSSAYLLPNITI
jgi:hypothetical protein